MGLPSCEYRQPLPGMARQFYCRHSSVKREGDIVTDKVCSQCTNHDVPCPTPRLYVAQPALVEREVDVHYTSCEQLVSDVRAFLGQLPPDLSGVAGIPRSGMLPASLLATLLHLPLFETSAQEGVRALGQGLRMESLSRQGNGLLVIDDSSYSGYAIHRAREAIRAQLPHGQVIYAAMYPRPEAIKHLDLYARIVPAPHLFEWNLFNCNQTDFYAFDLDGIICQDWPGGDENGPEYLRFVQNAKPLWLPRRRMVPMIVTARLEKHRLETLKWLARHGVHVHRLKMGPWNSAEERRRCYDPGAFKGRHYAESKCRLFIESSEDQARAIWESSRKPVLCPTTGALFL